MEKIKLIKDTIWGAIPYSKLEGHIFSSLIFNRLHYILQNSLAFFVYPSLKTSRFSHSVGVMHCAGLIFLNSLKNAEDSIIKEFLKEARDEIKKILEEDKYGNRHIEKSIIYLTGKLTNSRSTTQEEIKTIRDDIRQRFKNQIKEARIITDINYLGLLLGKKFIATYPFPRNNINDISGEDVITFSVLFQLIRLLGLTHDIGHLPFSHLFEDFIEEYVNSRETNYLEELKKYLERSRGKKIHELLGDSLREYLLFYDIPEIIFDSYHIEVESQNLPENLEKELVTIYSFAKIIYAIDKYKDEFPALEALYRIISNDLDADRIDYIQRDGRNSGLFRETGDVTRIIYQFVLVKNDNKFEFLPAIQSLNDISELLIDRFRDYQYVIAHHKVLRLDSLLKRIFHIITDIELYEKSTKQETESYEYGPQNFADIFGYLYEILNFEEKSDDVLDLMVKFKAISKLNDNWVFEYLRSKYFEYLKRKSRYLEPQVASGELVKEFILCAKEFFSVSNKFKSLWKRYDDFKNLVENTFNTKEDKEKVDNIYNKLVKIKEAKIGEDQQTQEEKADYKNIDLYSKVNFILDFLIEKIKGEQEVAKEIQKNLDIEYILVRNISKLLKPGFKNLKLVDLNNHSKIFKAKDEVLNSLWNFLETSGSMQPRTFIFSTSEALSKRAEILRVLMSLVEKELKNLEGGGS